MKSIRPEHAELITTIADLPGAAHPNNYPESVIGALIIADEIRRSTQQICKTLNAIEEARIRNSE